LIAGALVAIAGAFTTGALIFRDQDDEGWIQEEEKKFLDRVVEPGHTEARVETGHFGATIPPSSRESFPVTRSGPRARLRCTRSFSLPMRTTRSLRDDSPTLLKADAAAQRAY
jgi:hypothetical protein